jgi:hypothetical protein
VVRHRGPSSESEFRSRGALGPAVCWAAGVTWTVAAGERNLPLVGSFMFLLFREKLGTPAF